MDKGGKQITNRSNNRNLDWFIDSFKKSYHKCNIKESQEYNIQKRMEVINMIKLFKKTLAICLIGLGLGILLVLLLPITGWLFMIGVIVVCVGFMWLAC